MQIVSYTESRSGNRWNSSHISGPLNGIDELRYMENPVQNELAEWWSMEYCYGTEEAAAEDSSADKKPKFLARKDRALGTTIVLSIDPSLLYLVGEP